VDQRGRIGRPVFFGTYTHTIDAKGRTALPARLREALAAAGEPRLVLMRNSISRSILALPSSAWAKVTENVMAASPFDAVAQRNVLKFVASAHPVDLDQSGRVLVPPDLRDWAGLAKDVVWAGMGPHVILFDKAIFDAEMSQEVPPEARWDFFKGRT
jgi:MraZ protein